MIFDLCLMEVRKITFKVKADSYKEACRLLFDEGTMIDDPGGIDHKAIEYVSETDIEMSVE